jgi:outer membrane protein
MMALFKNRKTRQQGFSPAVAVPMLAGLRLGRAVGAVCLLLAVCFTGKFAAAQQPGAQAPDYTQDPKWFPQVLNPYTSRKIPKPDFVNTPDVSQLIHDGKLQLSVAQLVAAVMENNLGIASARYNRYFSQTDVLRAKAGSAPRGSQGVTIPSGLFSGAVGAGLSNVVGLTPANGPAINSSGRVISGITPRGGYDPAINLNFSIDRANSPLNSIRVSGVPNSITSTATLQARYGQAFTSGTSFSASFNSQRQSSNQKNLIFNPAYVPSLSVAITQQLLNGFSLAVNRRYLHVARNGRLIAREFYRQQVTTTLAQAQNSYWDLVAFRETVRAAEQALQVGQQLYENNKKQAEVGTLARLDVVSAESEVASRQRDLIVAQTNLQKAEVQLKYLLSKDLDPALAAAQVETTDPLPEPQDPDIPQLEQALAAAQRNRPELPQAEGNILNETIADRYTRDTLKPTLFVFGLFTSNSLYGDLIIRDASGRAIAVTPGGWATALSQSLRWNYPDYSFGLSLTIPIKNRSAQADNLRARLEERQAETALQNTRNQINLEVRNAVIGLMQAKAQVQAARQALEFERQTVDAEEKKLAAGVSTPYNVILVQRDLLTAELAEVKARTNYAKARVEMDRSTGVLLEKNHIDPAEVPRGQFPTGLSSASSQ